MKNGGRKNIWNKKWEITRENKSIRDVDEVKEDAAHESVSSIRWNQPEGP